MRGVSIKLKELPTNSASAVLKPREDVENTLRKHGYTEFQIYDKAKSKYAIAVQYMVFWFKMITARTNINIFIQHKTNGYAIDKTISMIGKLKKIKKWTVIFLIHDIEFLRKPSEKCDEERKILDTADILIVHSQEMLEQVTLRGIHTSKYILQCFDYLYAGKLATIVQNKTKEVVFAGNLSKTKSGFLYQKNCFDFQFNLYGNLTEEIQMNYIHKGSYSPDELIQNLEGNYGLVWDGDSAETCAGHYGEYLKYNAPHKFSLYIAAGLPVIVWSQSAMADLVREKKIGYCIDRLADINDLPNWDNPLYQEILENVNRMSIALRNGEHLGNILNEIERMNG